MSQPPTAWVNIAGVFHQVRLFPDGTAEVDGKGIDADIRLVAPGIASILLTLPNGTTRSFHCIAENGDAPAVIVNGQRLPYVLADRRSVRAVAVPASESGPRPLKAPMPGRIVRVLVADGDTVAAGQGCVVIEAMKMQNELKAPRAGTVARLSVAIGDTVASGATLLIVE